MFNKAFEKSGFFKGLTDWHCHILPGVDDGVSRLDDSLAILEEYEKVGISSVWLTPHVMEDIPNTPEKLKSAYDNLLAEYKGGISLHLAAENMMDSLFAARLEKGEVLPLGTDRLLVETSCFNPPFDMDGILRSVKSKGYYPVLAHPERYVYMDFDRYRDLKNSGVLFQLNLTSLAGYYGTPIRHRAEKLLKLGYYELYGTDLHKMDTFITLLGSKLARGVIKQLELIKNA